MTKTNRRAVIGAFAFAPLAIGAVASAIAGATCDALIEAAWLRLQQAYAAYNDLPLDDGPSIDGFAPRERELWAVIDEAEECVRSAVATTPRGVMIQLWCAMYHSVSWRADDDALTQANFAALDRADSNMDWNVRLMLAALRSLQSMEA